MKYTQEQIETAVEQAVDDWDIQTLITFCIEERVEYYMSKNVCEKELELLMKGQ